MNGYRFSNFRITEYDFYFCNVNEVLGMLEDSNDFSCAGVLIEPPAVDDLTDEDSGDDETGTIQNLNGRQLAARATATVIRADGRQQVGEDDESNVGYTL